MEWLTITEEKKYEYFAIDDPELKKVFSDLGIFDVQGNLTIPVFEGEWPARLENMAKKVYAKTIELVDSTEMKQILGMKTQAQAAMFIHYEIRYAFLSLLLEKGIIELPVDLDNADSNRPEDVGSLLFLIKSNWPGLFMYNPGWLLTVSIYFSSIKEQSIITIRSKE